MIRTKIVCTIGPASRDPQMLKQLIEAGLDVARINFSHGSHSEHAENISRIREAAQEVGKPVAILADLQGPKLRVGDMEEGGVLVRQGELVKLTTRDVSGQRLEGGETCQAEIPVQYDDLPQDVQPGERILIDDGLIELLLEDVEDTEMRCRVVTGGVIQDNKGLNVPGSALSIPAVTEKDWQDIDFALAQGIDWLGLSFVRSAEEVYNLQEVLNKKRTAANRILLMAKIEKPQALDSIEGIVDAADGIMVARGDLGIEIPTEKVPMVQKRLIRLANAAGKPVITATQMLDSMIRNPRPTRAEASDVANAILDGSDAVMLSGETAVGKYPVEAVKTMRRIAEEIEAATLTGPWTTPAHIPDAPDDVTDAVSHATAYTAYDLRVAAIIASTASGRTARNIAKYRPHTRIIAVTINPLVQRQLMMTWGVTPLLAPREYNTDIVLQNAIDAAHDAGLVQYGARVVLTAGVTSNMPGTTNLMTVELVKPQRRAEEREKELKAAEETGPPA